MNVVWAKHNVTVQDVVDSIPRPLAYTTVMTTIKILGRKRIYFPGEETAQGVCLSSISFV